MVIHGQGCAKRRGLKMGGKGKTSRGTLERLQISRGQLRTVEAVEGFTAVPR